MLIYKITNSINDKIYIGQTIHSLAHRWSGHKRSIKGNKTNYPMYNAMRKHGVEHFKIEEIGGANNITELNYQEWLEIEIQDTVWPNGYNLKKGGGSKGKHSRYMIDSNRERAIEYHKTHKSTSCKVVIDIVTKETWESVKDAAKANSITPSALSPKLLGKTGNETNLRYVGMEGVHKKHKKMRLKPVTDIKTQKIWKNVKACCNDLKYDLNSLRKMLRGSKINKTNLRYVGQEDVCKTKHNKRKKVINTETGQTWESAKECARENNIKYSTLSNKLNGCNYNNTDFIYLKDR